MEAPSSWEVFPNDEKSVGDDRDVIWIWLADIDAVLSSIEAPGSSAEWYFGKIVEGG